MNLLLEEEQMKNGSFINSLTKPQKKKKKQKTKGVNTCISKSSTNEEDQ
jgi:hypothetical protein